MSVSAPVQLLHIGILAALCLWLYWSTLIHLVGQWRHDPNFSHGFFVPLFSIFMVWQRRAELSNVAVRPSWSGLLLLAGSMCVLIVGQMGAELFLARFSLLLVLASLIVLFLGWNFFRRLFFPWAFLILMIPLPAIVFNQITFPLQLLASRLAAAVLPLFGVPILRDGNVIILPGITLEVAEACSGIRSLMSLVTLSIIYGFLTEKRLWVRWLLVLASVPVAVAANSIRIIGTGLLVQYWDADKAEGRFHVSWGLITFATSLLMLYLLHSLINKLAQVRSKSTAGNAEIPGVESARPFRFRMSVASFVSAAAVILASALFLQERSRAEIFPPRTPLRQFPAEFGAWSGTDVPMDKNSLEVLGHGDFLLRSYHNHQQDEPNVDLFIAYFPSQRTGDTIHSPKHCLPGAGWTPVVSTRLQLAIPGHAPFPANRYIIAKGDDRRLVLYWYWAHDRGVASEYWAKYYLIADSIKMNRSDGALVRIMTPMLASETAAAAEQRLLPFARYIVPLLNNYIPR